jgi:hypothetical protein
MVRGFFVPKFAVVSSGMTADHLKDCEHEQQAAEAALHAAQSMPPGPERHFCSEEGRANEV